MEKNMRITEFFAWVFITALSFSFTVQADEKARPEINADSEIRSVTSLTDKEARDMSFAAGRVLQHVENARIAISGNDTDKALKQVDQGLKLIHIIQNTAPKIRVVTDIKSGDISYHDEDEVAQRYIAVLSGSYIEDILTPIVQARQERIGSQMKSKKESKFPGTPSAISTFDDFCTWRQTTMKLDVLLAKRLMEGADKSIRSGNYEDADAALLDLETRAVTFTYSEAQLPLIAAADSLKRAQLQIKSGENAQALSTLKLASDELKKYEQITGGNRGKEVRVLHHEIDNYIKTLEGEHHLKKTMENTDKMISSWWDRAVKWFQ
jgi:hypothetical protein